MATPRTNAIYDSHDPLLLSHVYSIGWCFLDALIRDQATIENNMQLLLVALGRIFNLWLRCKASTDFITDWWFVDISR